MATIDYGNMFREADAGIEASISLKEMDSTNNPVSNLALSSLIVKKGENLLTKIIDYWIDDDTDTLFIDPSYLNSLSQGSHYLTIIHNELSSQVQIDVLQADSSVLDAVQAVNNANDVSSTRNAIESLVFNLQMTPYLYLSSSQRDQVAQEILNRKGTGYKSRIEIQDLMDIIVDGIQNGGDEASAIYAVNTASTSKKMLEALLSPQLHLDNQNYVYLEDYELEIVGTYLIENKGAGYASRDAIQAELNNIITMILDDWYDIVADADSLKLSFASGDSSGSVTQDITLPNIGAKHGANIVWSSDNPAIISNSGAVTLPSEDTEVILTANLTNRYEKFEKQFRVIVKGNAAP